MMPAVLRVVETSENTAAIASSATRQIESTPGVRSRTLARAGIAVAVLVVTTLLVVLVDARSYAVVCRWKIGDSVNAVLECIRVPGNYVFTMMVALLLLGRHRKREALMLLTAGGIASLGAIAIKLLARRARPFRELGAFSFWNPYFAEGSHRAPNFSFPSADTALAFASAVVVAHVWPRWRLPCFAWATAVGIARLLQHAHFPSDIFAGAALGICVGVAVCAYSPRDVRG